MSRHYTLLPSPVCFLWMILLLSASVAAKGDSFLGSESVYTAVEQWVEAEDEQLVELLEGDESDYNYARLIVVPYRASEDGGNGSSLSSSSSWEWEQVEGLRYLYQPDRRFDHLGNKESPLSGLLDNSTVLGVMEFEKGGNVTLDELLSVYRGLKSSNVFQEVFLDKKVQLSQSTSAVETIRRISVLGPELDSRTSRGIPSAPLPDLSGVVAELRLNDSALARVVAAVGNATNVVPQDSDWRQQWNVRQVRGDFTLGSSITVGMGAVVAVLDTGCVMNHPDLQPNLWVNEAELNGRPGVDDDGNGFVDDVHGYNFVSNTGDVSDDNGHGSHVAGTIGAVVNNTVGVTGLAPKVKIMCLKFMDATGAGFQSSAILAMAYAVQMNATVQNHSWGSPSGSTTLENMVRLSGRFGHFMAAAAGNEGSDTDTPGAHSFPAAYASPELFSETSEYVVSVGASDRRDRRAGFSNFGVQTVDLSAPGTEILSLGNLPNTYVEKQGTSQATPLVAATAACVMSILNLRLHVQEQRGRLSGAEIVAITKRIITQTVDYIPELDGVSRTGGRLNTFSAVQLALMGDTSLIRRVEATRFTTLSWWAFLLIAIAVAVVAIGASIAVYLCLAPKKPAPQDTLPFKIAQQAGVQQTTVRQDRV